MTRSDRIKQAILDTPRRFFVGEEHYKASLKDKAVPIGYGYNATTPSQIEDMLSLLNLNPKLDKVLEIGTGCGWQTALLTKLAKSVYSIEQHRGLYERALHNLSGYPVVLSHGDGVNTKHPHGPFSKIICCAAISIEQAHFLVNQLGHKDFGDVGILIAPVGDTNNQSIYRFVKVSGKISAEKYEDCGFVVSV